MGGALAFPPDAQNQQPNENLMGDDIGGAPLRGSAPTTSLDRAVNEREEIMKANLDTNPDN